MTTYLATYIILSIATSVLSYGHALAYWWFEFKSLQCGEDRWAEVRGRAFCGAALVLLFPLGAIFVNLPLFGTKHGLLYRKPTDPEL